MKISIDFGSFENECFVVMPFNEIFNVQYHNVIKPAIEELGLSCVRGDEIYSEERIVNDIWNSIRKFRFVVAELTDKNPNVLYEIGLAHAIGKPVISITRNKSDVPFDLRDLRFIYYDITHPFWGENLKTSLKEQIEKLINQNNITSYLPGIDLSEVNSRISELSPIGKDNSLIDERFNGIWVGEHLNNHPNIENGREIITLSLNIANGEIEATSTIKFIYKDDVSVTNELYRGYFEGNTLKLFGMNYTIVHREREILFHQNNFELELVEGSKLKGIIIDSDSKMSEEILFEKKLSR